MEHTPGPWHVFDNQPNGGSISINAKHPTGTGNVEIALMNAVLIGRKHTATRKADAQLIAAAPDLLKELESAVEAIYIWHKDYQPCDDQRCVICLDLPRYEAAIAKATGE